MTTWPPKESISNLNMKPKGNTPLLLSTRLGGLTLWSALCSQSLYFNPKSNNRVSALRGELKPLGFLPSSRPVERLSWTSAGGPAAMGKQAWCGQPDSWARSCRNALALPWPTGGQPHHWMFPRKTKTWTEEEAWAMAKVEKAKTRQFGLGSCFISQQSPLLY